jgi:hypothetical protein
MLGLVKVVGEHQCGVRFGLGGCSTSRSVREGVDEDELSGPLR